MLFVNIRQISSTINDRLKQISTNSILSNFRHILTNFVKSQQISTNPTFPRQNSTKLIFVIPTIRQNSPAFNILRQFRRIYSTKFVKLFSFTIMSRVDSWRWLSEFVDYRRYSTKFQSSCFTSLYLLCK